MSLNIALTGKSGLIGATVYRTLLNAGHRIWTLGRCDDNYQLDLGDFSPPGLDSRIDAFVHCAGITDEEIKEDKTKSINRGTQSLVDLVDWVKEKGIPHFIYISSAHVYGDLNREIDENKETDPDSLYGMLHLFAEQYIRSQFNHCLILRPSAVYGPIGNSFKRWELIPYSFPRDLFINRQIVIRSHGKQWRNFVSTAKIADLIEKNLVEYGKKIINPLGAHSMSIRSFADFCTDTLQPYASTQLNWAVRADEVYESHFAYLSVHDQPEENKTVLREHLVTIFQEVERLYGSH